MLLARHVPANATTPGSCRAPAVLLTLKMVEQSRINPSAYPANGATDRRLPSSNIAHVQLSRAWPASVSMGIAEEVTASVCVQSKPSGRVRGRSLAVLRTQLASHLEGNGRAADGFDHNRDLVAERFFATILTPGMLDRERLNSRRQVLPEWRRVHTGSACMREATEG